VIALGDTFFCSSGGGGDIFSCRLQLYDDDTRFASRKSGHTAGSVRSSGLIEQRGFKRFSSLLLGENDHNIQFDSTFSVVRGECGKMVVIRE
jgi:hypothetical protein